jgi:hypothetical protein
MRNQEKIDVECRVFTRYLTGQLPDSYIAEKYAAAFLPGQPLSKGLQSGFDALLVRLAVIHPLITRAVDAFARFFYTNSTLSKRLIILLAILESQASTAVRLDYPDKTVFAGFMLSAAMQLTVFAILLGIATLFLLPLKLLLGRQPVKY